MATTPLQFTDGTEGSASQVSAAFTTLRTQGQTSINACVVLRENTLLLFQNALSALNGKRVRANRVPTVGVSARFVASDLQDINQAITTASLRCDANAIALKERATPGEAAISSISFAASEGTIQALQVPSTSSSGDLGALYRVATPDGSTPVGTFSISLLAPIGVSLILFDMMDMPSDPTITVSISTNGITYTPSVNINRNGYRVGAWFPAGTEAQYIQIAITPALPDTLNGSVFTFGLTDFHVFTIQYHLLSNVYTSQIEITPIGAQLLFQAPTVPGIIYFLSLAGNPAIEVSPGELIDIPGTVVVTNQNYGLVDTNKLNFTLPADAYLPSLMITNAASGDVVRIAPGLDPSTTGLTNQYFTLDGSGIMYLIDYVSEDAGSTYYVSYVTGPATIIASLQVQLSTSDLNTTPLYTGAELIEV